MIPATGTTEQSLACAAALMELAPLIMRTMRQELSAHAALDLSVVQFRALRFVARRRGASLSDVAEHLGMTLPAASKLIDRVLEQGLLTRDIDHEDRRRVVLALTEQGQQGLERAHAAAQQRLAQLLQTLSEDELAQCVQAFSLLRGALA